MACAADQAIRIAVLGDSLTAGYGLAEEHSFPAQLEKRLAEKGKNVTVINAGISGDTTAGGLARLDWMLKSSPDLVIIELGGNDALRGLDPNITKQNLEHILQRLQKENVSALLAGMRAPRNLGKGYYTKFDALYPELAATYHVPLYPFFLEGVAGDPDLNLADGIHPNRDGYRVIVRNIIPYLTEMIETLER